MKKIEILQCPKNGWWIVFISYDEKEVKKLVRNLFVYFIKKKYFLKQNKIEERDGNYCFLAETREYPEDFKEKLHKALNMTVVDG